MIVSEAWVQVLSRRKEMKAHIEVATQRTCSRTPTDRPVNTQKWIHSSNLESNRCICVHLLLNIQRPWNLHQIKRILSASKSCIFNNEHRFLARMQSCANTKEFVFLYLLVYTSSDMNLYALHLLVSLPSLKETNVDIFVPPWPTFSFSPEGIIHLCLTGKKKNPTGNMWGWWCMKDWVMLCLSDSCYILYEHSCNKDI